MFGSSTYELTPGGETEYGQTLMGRSGKNESTSYDPVSVSSSQSGGASSSRGPPMPRTVSGNYMVHGSSLNQRKHLLLTLLRSF